MPQVNDYIVDPVLTSFSVAYNNAEFIADNVFPRLQVPAKTGFYYVFDKSKFTIEDDRRTGISRAKRVDYGMTKTPYGPLYEHSLEEGIEYAVRDTYPSPHSAREDATENVTQRMMLIHEKAVRDIVFSSTYITQYDTLAGTDRWDDYGNSDPFGDIQTGFDTIQANGMVTANSAIMGYQVWSKLKFHPDLLGRMSVATLRVLTEELFAALVGVQNVWVGKAMYNTAKEGQTPSMSYVWDKNFLLAYINPSPRLKAITLGYTLAMMNGRVVDRWDEPWNKAEFVRVTDYYQAFLVAAEAGYLLKTVVN